MLTNNEHSDQAQKRNMESRLFLLFTLLSSLILSGCSPGIGKVEGKVTLKGKQVPGGLVTFRPKDATKNSVSAQLDRDGKYSVELPVGEVLVCIDNREFEPQPKAGVGIPLGISLPADALKKMGANPSNEPPPEIDPTKTADAPVVRESGRYLKLPDKYYQVETSGLSFEVVAGPQTKDFTLE